MSPERKETFRTSILRVLDAQRGRFGLSQRAIGVYLNEYGFSRAEFKSSQDKSADDLFEDAIEDALAYLQQKNLAEEVLKIVSKENRAWRITRAGLAFIDEQP